MPLNRMHAQFNVKTRLALRIRVLRHKRGWSQEMLAQLARLHRNYIGRVESGEITVGLTKLEALARAFGLSISDFMGGV